MALPRKISVIVPAFNEEKLLPGTLRAINQARAAFTERGLESELIVCDNNSSDTTAEVAREAGALVVFEPVNQIGRARNRGAAAATGDWLLFIDADSAPSPGLFADVAEAVRNGQVLAGGSTMRLDDSSWIARATTRVWNFISCTSGALAGSFIFCEAAAFREVGGFNLELFASEELDLTRRLKALARRNGRKIVVLRRHPLRTSARKLTLYTKAEYFRFLVKTLAGWGRNLRSAEECHIWYDGRR